MAEKFRHAWSSCSTQWTTIQYLFEHLHSLACHYVRKDRGPQCLRGRLQRPQGPQYLTQLCKRWTASLDLSHLLSLFRRGSHGQEESTGDRDNNARDAAEKHHHLEKSTLSSTGPIFSGVLRTLMNHAASSGYWCTTCSSAGHSWIAGKLPLTSRVKG